MSNDDLQIDRLLTLMEIINDQLITMKSNYTNLESTVNKLSQQLHDNTAENEKVIGDIKKKLSHLKSTKVIDIEDKISEIMDEISTITSIRDYSQIENKLTILEARSNTLEGEIKEIQVEHKKQFNDTLKYIDVKTERLYRDKSKKKCIIQ
jgi:predicted  nucleic acid-binding Zn-ribbon protein